MIAAIPEKDWVPIAYWIGDGADVAETTYQPFSDKHAELRLVTTATPSSRT